MKKLSFQTILRCVFCALLGSLMAVLLLRSIPAQAADAGSKEADDNVLYLKARQFVMSGRFEEAAPLLERALKTDTENAYLNFQLSEVYLRLNNFERAETLGKKAVDLEPNNTEYRKSLGATYATLKKYPEAKEQYVKIAELDPQNQSAPLLIGILEAESGNMEKGVEALSKVLADNADNVMALFYRAKIYLEMDQIEKAKFDLDKCLTLKPSFVEAGTALGLIYEKTNQTEEAIKVYSRIQGGGQFTKRLAQLYLQKNEYDKALQTLLEYEKSSPDDYTARVKVALIYHELKDYKNAEERLVKIIKEQPEADNVHFHLARVYEEQKQTDKALKEFRKVSKDSGIFYIESVLRVGAIYRERNQLKEGIEYSKKILDKNPDVVEFYDMHASFFEASKDYKKALSVIEQGLKRSANDEKLLYFQGALFDKTGNRKGAVEVMQKIIASNPENAHALNFLAYTWAEMGENLEQAENHAKKALSLRPGDGYIQDTLGWIQFKRGNLDEAIATLEKAAQLQPEEAVILDHLGDVYLKKQEYAKANDFYKKAKVASSKKDKEMSKKIEAKLSDLSKEKRIPSASKAN